MNRRSEYSGYGNERPRQLPEGSYDDEYRSRRRGRIESLQGDEDFEPRSNERYGGPQRQRPDEYGRDHERGYGQVSRGETEGRVRTIGREQSEPWGFGEHDSERPLGAGRNYAGASRLAHEFDPYRLQAGASYDAGPVLLRQGYGRPHGGYGGPGRGFDEGGATRYEPRYGYEPNAHRGSSRFGLRESQNPENFGRAYAPGGYRGDEPGSYGNRSYGVEFGHLPSAREYGSDDGDIYGYRSPHYGRTPQLSGEQRRPTYARGYAGERDAYGDFGVRSQSSRGTEQPRGNPAYGSYAYGAASYGPGSDVGDSNYPDPGPSTGRSRLQGASGDALGYRYGTGFSGRGPKGYTRSDERIREDISERLSDDPAIDASDITLEVKDGKVTLTGQVEARWIKHSVEDMVDRCAGVREIDNRLGVAPASSSASVRSGSPMAAGAASPLGTEGSEGAANRGAGSSTIPTSPPASGSTRKN